MCECLVSTFIRRAERRVGKRIIGFTLVMVLHVLRGYPSTIDRILLREILVNSKIRKLHCYISYRRLLN